MFWNTNLILTENVLKDKNDSLRGNDLHTINKKKIVSKSMQKFEKTLFHNLYSLHNTVTCDYNLKISSSEKWTKGKI